MKDLFPKNIKENVSTITKIVGLMSVLVSIIVFIYSKPSEIKVKKIAKNEDIKVKNELLLIIMG
ncbi:MAG: hypothetical protein IIA48_09555 [Bacteroidetes bacterium]|nr:hypothetical protein [Bacteroidota bacterium]